jgi:glycogen phosphorylase
MKHIQAFQVFPKLPGSLSFLGVLSRNMWWSWKPDAIELFRRVEPRLWEESGRNPIVFATQVPQERLKKLSKDDSFLAHLDRVRQQFKERVLASPDIGQNPYGSARIAYFSMEFGIHESLPLFAGGLGVLAGDHLKSASHMGLPMVAVGSAIPAGVFSPVAGPQWLATGNLSRNRLVHLALDAVKAGDGGGLRISVEGPDGVILADVWKIMIGRVPLSCWTPMCWKTRPRYATSPVVCTTAIRESALRRKSCWASAACGPWRPWASSRPYAI